MRTTGRRKTTSHAWKKQGPGKNSACPLISSRSPHTRSDQSEPTFAGIRPTGVPRFRAAQIVGARFAFFVSLAHGRIRGQTERFLVSFEKTSFVHNDWGISKWENFLSCPQLPTLGRRNQLESNHIRTKRRRVWTNVYTVIRFTYEEPEAAKRRLLDLEAKHGVIATKSFQVRLDSLPFSQWSALCQ